MKVESTKLWTQAEYARHIGRNRTFVHRLIEKGKLKSVKIKGTVLVVAE
jgi:hypothetical protein